MHINSTPLEAVMAKDARPREWPPGEGEMARRIRAFDWASTPLGPIDTWPQGLRSSIQAMSSSACRSERLSAIDPDGSNAGEDVAEFSLADDNFDMRAYIHRLLEARHAEAEERKSTEKALRESEERLRTALQAGKMAYWTWNSAERVLVASDALVELIGLLPNQDLRGGMETFELVHPEDRKAASRTGRTPRSSRGKGWHSTYRIVRPRDGQVAWLEERAEVSHDPAVTRRVSDRSRRDHGDRRRAPHAVRPRVPGVNVHDLALCRRRLPLSTGREMFDRVHATRRARCRPGEPAARSTICSRTGTTCSSNAAIAGTTASTISVTAAGVRRRLLYPPLPQQGAARPHSERTAPRAGTVAVVLDLPGRRQPRRAARAVGRACAGG